MKRLILLLLAVVVAGGAWRYLSGRDDESPAERTDENHIAEVSRRNIDFSVKVSGDITPVTQLEVKTEVSGKVKKLHVKPGQDVKEGAPLVDIDDTDLLTEKAAAETEIEGAQLSVDKTRRNFLRSKDLFESKLISREVYDNLASDLAIAENNLIKAERKLQIVDDKLRKTQIFAPTAGTILAVPVTDGQVVVAAASVNSGTTLMTIANLSQLLVDTHVNQIDVARIRPGQRVSLTGETLKDDAIPATISFIAPVASVKNNVKGFEVEALVERPDARLRPGMTVLMEIPVAHAQEAVSVPISAVFSEDGGEVVYVVQATGTEKRPVTVGVSDLQFAEIKSGVDVGERILLVRPGRVPKQS